MSAILAIDPGVRLCGVALFAGVQLVEATIVRCTEKNVSDFVVALTMAKQLPAAYVDTLVIERMLIYDKAQQLGDPNHLARIEFIAGVLTRDFKGLSANVLRPTAREWKGTIRKSIHHKRIIAECPKAAQLAAATPKTYRHNVYDAVGLGLWAIRRNKSVN